MTHQPFTGTLAEALAQAIERYIAANPESKSIFERASQHLPGGNTRTTLFSAPFSLCISIASGTRVRSLDGAIYTDFVGEYTAGIYGHSHPSILSALEQSLGNGLNFGATSPLEGEFAARLKKRFQKAGLEMLRFVNSGTEANLMAIATARNWTGKQKVLVFEGGYHGSVLTFGKKGTRNPMQAPGDFVIAKYSAKDDVQGMAQSGELEDLAAILIEPMQGAGGCLHADVEFLRYVRELATEKEALLIHDEVMTSRLWYEGGLSGKYGVVPDLVTMGKYLGGGMSFGMFGGRREIMEMFNPVGGATVTAKDGSMREIKLGHSGTFNNNVMTMNAGIAGNKILTKEVLEQLNELGDYLRTSLTTLLAEKNMLDNFDLSTYDKDAVSQLHKGKIWISGLGSMNHIHFGANDDLTELQDLFYFHMVENEIYPTRRGSIFITIQHTKEDIGKYVDAVRSFIEFYGLL